MKYLLHIVFFCLVLVLTVTAVQLGGCSKSDTPVTPTVPGDTTSISDKMRPIIFVHGFLESADMFTATTQLFAANGYTDANLHAFDFIGCINTTNDNADIQKMTTQLETKINAVIQATGTDRVDIVAHAIGAQPVQNYLTKLGGKDKVAHVVYVGGIMDLSLKLDGVLCPKPVKYRTIRSDGQDATQQGNAANGALDGADNQQVAGLDNLQLLSGSQSFPLMFKFFTGTDATIKVVNGPQYGASYDISGVVVNFADNTPVPNANIRIVQVKKIDDGTIQRQGNSTVLTADASGKYTTKLTMPHPAFAYEIWISAPGYFDMHLYRQQWKANSKFDRFRMFPKSPTNVFLQSLVSSLKTGQFSTICVLSLNRAIYSNRDVLKLYKFDAQPEITDSLSVLNAQNAPAPGGSGSGSNTFALFLQDYDGNQKDGTGPLPVPLLNMFGINSFDAYLDGTSASFQTGFLFNNTYLTTQNWRSTGTTPAMVVMQFEY